jgi:hypothetical protein
MWSPIKILNVSLDCVAAAGLAVGGLGSIAGSGFDPRVLAYGLAVAAVAKAVSAPLKQAAGDSDETQGITPAQVASKAAATAATLPPPVVVTDPVTKVTTITQGGQTVVLPPVAGTPPAAVTSKP